MSAIVCKDWRELSKAASREQDPEKLMELVEQLNKVLEERENNLRRQLDRQPPAPRGLPSKSQQSFLTA